MPVRWTGSARKFLTGSGADSHPTPSLLISRARQVAGDLLNQMALSGNGYGFKRFRLDDSVEILATAINNFPGIEPLVELEILVDGEAPEEDEEERPPGIVVAWPDWEIPPPAEGEFSNWPALIVPSVYEIEEDTQEVSFRTSVFTPTDSEFFTGAQRSYRKYYPKGIQVGNVDWQGRGEEYVLTWAVTSGVMAGIAGQNVGGLRARSKPASSAVLFAGKIIFILSGSQFGVLGAAIETRGGEDFLNIILRSDDGSGDFTLLFVTRPFRGPVDTPVEVLSTLNLPAQVDAAQPIFFNDSGSTAVGVVERFNLSSTALVENSWRKPFEGSENNVTRALLGEVTMSSNGSTQLELKEFDNYAVMPDPSNPGAFHLVKHPNLGSETGWPVATPSQKLTVATDWKGDTLVRCTVTVKELTSVETFNWVNNVGTGNPRTDSGSFSGATKDILVEFENSTLEPFHQVELVSNEGSFSVSIGANGEILDEQNLHSSQTIHRHINFLDLRFDFISIAEVTSNVSLTRAGAGNATPSREADLVWTLKQGPNVLKTAAEPRFNQSIWAGQSIFGDTLHPVDIDYTPDIWSASLAYFGPNPGIMIFGLFGGLFYSVVGSVTFFHGFFGPPLANFFSLHALGVPFVDYRTHIASYKGDISAYLHFSGWRLINAIEQGEWRDARATGQQLVYSGMTTPFGDVDLNTHLGISGGLGLRYELEVVSGVETDIAKHIPNITLV